MTARVTLGLVLLLLQTTAACARAGTDRLLMYVCGVYRWPRWAPRLLAAAAAAGPHLRPAMGLD